MVRVESARSPSQPPLPPTPPCWPYLPLPRRFKESNDWQLQDMADELVSVYVDLAFSLGLVMVVHALIYIALFVREKLQVSATGGDCCHCTCAATAAPALLLLLLLLL